MEVILRPFDDGNGGQFELMDYWNGMTVENGFKNESEAQKWADMNGYEIVEDNFHVVKLNQKFGKSEK